MINSECINELFGYFVVVLINLEEEICNIVYFLGVIFFF